MIVGFIGFGEVASTLSSKLISNGCEVVSSSNNRTPKTKKLISELGIKDLGNNLNVAKSSDILISSVSPGSAIDIAKKYGKFSDIFLDLNNISPITAKNILNIVGRDKFINGSIVGRVSSEDSIIYVSIDQNSEENDSSKDNIISKISYLNDSGLNIKFIGNSIEDASTIKTLRSIYTKGLSALLVETFQFAKELGLEEELFDIIAITEGENFKTSAKSRINSSIKNSKRKYEELEYILEFLNNNFDNIDKNDILMIKSIEQKFKILKNDIN